MELTGITGPDLILSISIAIFNSVLHSFRLWMESNAVNERFGEYSLSVITARFEWIPYSKAMKRFQSDENQSLMIDYKIRYELPLVTYLS